MAAGRPAVSIAALLAPLSLLLLCLLPLPAQAQVAPPRGEAEQFGERLAATQSFIERRWLVLRLRLIMSQITPAGFLPALQAEAQRLGTRGPTQQDWNALNAELVRNIDAYLNFMEAYVRNRQPNWPKDHPRRVYDNSALITLESIRADAKDAVARRADPFPAMTRASKLYTQLVGSQVFIDNFPGRDEAVEVAMRSIKMPAPPRAQR